MTYYKPHHTSATAGCSVYERMTWWRLHRWWWKEFRQSLGHHLRNGTLHRWDWREASYGAWLHQQTASGGDLTDGYWLPDDAEIIP